MLLNIKVIEPPVEGEIGLWLEETAVGAELRADAPGDASGYITIGYVDDSGNLSLNILGANNPGFPVDSQGRIANNVDAG